MIRACESRFRSGRYAEVRRPERAQRGAVLSALHGWIRNPPPPFAITGARGVHNVPMQFAQGLKKWPQPIKAGLSRASSWREHDNDQGSGLRERVSARRGEGEGTGGESRRGRGRWNAIGTRLELVKRCSTLQSESCGRPHADV